MTKGNKLHGAEEKLRVAQLVKIFPAFYGILVFITVFIRPLSLGQLVRVVLQTECFVRGWGANITSPKKTYEGVSKSFRTGSQERELQMVQLSANSCSCIIIL
jgi:hypothetical protein